MINNNYLHFGQFWLQCQQVRKYTVRRNKFFIMNDTIKKEIAFRMIARSSTGFDFINDKYIIQQRNSAKPDLAWVRSVYILFSFYIELLLKSEVVLTQSFSSSAEIESKLKKLRHDIGLICKEIQNITDIGIDKVSCKNSEYEISTTFGKTIYVKDFNDIRYDFIEGKMRKLSNDEDTIIKESLNAALEIMKKIKYKHF